VGYAERLLLIVGEAANHLSPQFRNILAHEYGESLLTRVWLAVSESVPELLQALDELLAEEPKE